MRPPHPRQTPATAVLDNWPPARAETQSVPLSNHAPSSTSAHPRATPQQQERRYRPSPSTTEKNAALNRSKPRAPTPHRSTHTLHSALTPSPSRPREPAPPAAQPA